jgi:uncharacterized membrane protein YkvA (DUF1232 family)
MGRPRHRAEGIGPGADRWIGAEPDQGRTDGSARNRADRTVLLDFGFARVRRAGPQARRSIPTRMADPTESSKPPVRRRRGYRRRAMIGRTITLLALLPIAGRLPLHARIIVGLVGDARVPASRKALLAAAFGYVVSPVDLIPDRIPLLGVLDDFVVAALAVDAFLAGVPDAVLQEQLDAVGLPRAAFDQDALRVRRLVPRSIRRIVYRIPTALQLGARLAREAELGTRVRGLLDKEGSPA